MSEQAAAAEGFAEERWTYGGATTGTGGKRVALWYDAQRERLAFSGDKTGHYVVGSVYTVQVRRGDGGSVTRRGTPAFAGRHEDAEWAAALQAQDYAERQAIAADQLQRRVKRDPEIGRAIEPVTAIAAGMNYAQRDALVAMVTRAIYRA